MGGMPQGVDYAFGRRPSPGVLVAAGKEFVVRYGGPGTVDKWLMPDEAISLDAAGISIVANAEGAASGLLGGWNAGFSWAASADKWFRGCGMPAGRPIYLSVDFDVTPSQWATVSSALRGAASALGGAHRVGVYGGLNAIRWARRDGVAAWFWQTYAWSGGIWEPGNHIEQYRNGVDIDGADCDLDRAPQADYGQWKLTQGTGDAGMKLFSVKETGRVCATNGTSYFWIRNLELLRAVQRVWGLESAAVPEITLAELPGFGVEVGGDSVPIPPVVPAGDVTRAEVIAAFQAAKDSLEN